MTTPTPTNPWEPPLAPALTTTESIYRIVMTSLAIAGRTAEEVPTLAAVVALLDAARDLMVASGALWRSPYDMADVLRNVADEMDRIRAEEPPRPLLKSLKETIMSGRPKYTH